jgi:hypothetical protein
MPGDEGELRIRQLTADHVQVGAADAARLDPDEDLLPPGLRLGEVSLDERRAGPIEHHRAHDAMIADQYVSTIS